MSSKRYAPGSDKKKHYTNIRCRYCGKNLRASRAKLGEFCRERHKLWFLNPEAKNKKNKDEFLPTQKYPGFYGSPAWRDLRKDVLKKYGYACMRCGSTPKNRLDIHVDHIMPRRYFPALELNFNNLQVLCRLCNESKGNRHYSDYRPDNCRVPVHPEQVFVPKTILRKPLAKIGRLK